MMIVVTLSRFVLPPSPACIHIFPSHPIPSRLQVDDVEVQMLLATLNDILGRSEASCAEFRGKYEAYSYLWETDQAVAFAEFCEGAYAELPRSEDQVKAEADMEADEIPKQVRDGRCTSSSVGADVSRQAASVVVLHVSHPSHRIPSHAMPSLCAAPRARPGPVRRRDQPVPRAGRGHRQHEDPHRHRLGAHQQPAHQVRPRQPRGAVDQHLLAAPAALRHVAGDRAGRLC